MRTLDQIIDGLPAARRAKVTARGKQLISEERALRHVRQARDFTQQRMAELLGIDQAGVSKIENRSDMLLSTLKSYVEAMGGSLRLMAEFSDGAVELTAIGEGDARPKPRVKRSIKQRSRKPPLSYAND